MAVQLLDGEKLHATWTADPQAFPHSADSMNGADSFLAGHISYSSCAVSSLDFPLLHVQHPPTTWACPALPYPQEQSQKAEASSGKGDLDALAI